MILDIWPMAQKQNRYANTYVQNFTQSNTTYLYSCLTFYNTGSNCGLIEVPACHLVGRTDKTHKRPQDIRWPDQDASHASLEFQVQSNSCYPSPYLTVKNGHIHGLPTSCNIWESIIMFYEQWVRHFTLLPPSPYTHSHSKTGHGTSQHTRKGTQRRNNTPIVQQKQWMQRTFYNS
jgi:hypothetical protein